MIAVTTSPGKAPAGIGDLESGFVEALREAVLRQIDPILVVLFGSQARGTTHSGSDIDLLVIDNRPFSAARSRRKLAGNIRRALPADHHPVDVLLFDASELGRWRQTTNHVIARALREGVVLYERPGAR
jgi:predicted nucleotidyltransferase